MHVKDQEDRILDRIWLFILCLMGLLVVHNGLWNQLSNHLIDPQELLHLYRKHSFTHCNLFSNKFFVKIVSLCCLVSGYQHFRNIFCHHAHRRSVYIQEFARLYEEVTHNGMDQAPSFIPSPS